MISITRTKARATTAAATFLGAIVLATPLFAASADSTNATAARQEMASTSPSTMTPGPGSAAVEAHIKELHARLHITEAEKPQWDALAQVMRENAQAMDSIAKQRASDAGSMNAVDVVKSYSEVIQAHEDGMKKFVPAFEDLYNSLSDSQKKIADSLFRSHARAEAKKVASK